MMKVQQKYLSKPLMAQLEVTDFCNHKCLHCYNLDSKIENRPTTQTNDEVVIACAQKLIESEIFAVVITGGEPLIKKDLIIKIISLFRKNNIKVNLNSNITLLDNDIIAFLKDVEVGILTSCPSATPSSFEKLTGTRKYITFEENIKKLSLAGVRFTVNMVVTKDNLHEIRSTAERMKELGCRTFTASPMELNVDYPRFDLLLSISEVQEVIADLLWVQDTLGLRVDILEALPKCVFPETILTEKHSFLNRKCQAGRTSIAVSCNGDIRPCAHNSVSYGNILNESIEIIWDKMSDWRSLEYIPNECKDCIWLSRCNGGCRTSAKAAYGKWNSKDTWATTPPKVAPLIEAKQIELRGETLLQVNTNYKLREEDNSTFLIYNIKNDIYFMVNNMFYEFIKSFSAGEQFSFYDLSQKHNTTTDDIAFYDRVLFLIQKKILNII